MALKFIEGFEQFDTDDELHKGGWGGVGTSYLSIETGRQGGSTRAVKNTSTSGLRHTVDDTSDTVVVGFAVKFDGFVTNGDLMQWWFNGAEKITLKLFTGGELAVDRYSTNLGSTSGLGLTDGVWYYIELKILIANSGGTVDLKVDGVNVLSLTSQDTLQGTGAAMDMVSLRGSSNIDPVFDDLYVLDDSGSDNTDFLGDCIVETIFPDADGTTNDFTRVGGGSNNFQAVDDGYTPDEDTTYVHSSTASEKELYGFAALTTPVDTIYGVQVSMLARKEGSGSREVRCLARSSATEVEGDSKGLSVDYLHRQHMYENDPNGGGDWTESAVNAAEFGFKIQA